MLEIKREIPRCLYYNFRFDCCANKEMGKNEARMLQWLRYEICDKLRDKSLSELQQHKRHYHLSRKLKERAGREDSFEESLLSGTNEFKWNLNGGQLFIKDILDTLQAYFY